MYNKTLYATFGNKCFNWLIKWVEFMMIEFRQIFQLTAQVWNTKIDVYIYGRTICILFSYKIRAWKLNQSWSLFLQETNHINNNPFVHIIFSLCWVYGDAVLPQAWTPGNLKLQFILDVISWEVVKFVDFFFLFVKKLFYLLDYRVLK